MDFGPRVLVLQKDEKTTVYLDGRLVVQAEAGTVRAIQTYDKRSAKLAQMVLDELGITDYLIVPGRTFHYIEGVPHEVDCK